MYIVTAWLPKTQVEQQWMNKEVERMKSHGINAEIRQKNNNIAIFRDCLDFIMDSMAKTKRLVNKRPHN